MGQQRFSWMVARYFSFLGFSKDTCSSWNNSQMSFFIVTNPSSTSLDLTGRIAVGGCAGEDELMAGYSVGIVSELKFLQWPSD